MLYPLCKWYDKYKTNHKGKWWVICKKLNISVSKNDKMKNKIISLLAFILFCTKTIIAQVAVSEEPRHKPVFQNKYIRLLDVWLPPGDTTQYHIHATPSLFVHLSNTVISSQIMGEGWVKDQAETGKAWYRSFSPDILVHRICNPDMVPFHVNDIEILSSYNNTIQYKHLPFIVLFENERAVAYHLTNSSFNKQIINGRGPMIAELAAGEEVIYHDAIGKKSTKLKPGRYLYIEPGSSFYFTATKSEETNMVLFEIK